MDKIGQIVQRMEYLMGQTPQTDTWKMAMFAIGEAFLKECPTRSIGNNDVLSISTKISLLWKKYTNWIIVRNKPTPNLIQIIQFFKQEIILFESKKVDEWDTIVLNICNTFSADIQKPIGGQFSVLFGSYFKLIRPTPPSPHLKKPNAWTIPVQFSINDEFKSKYVREYFDKYINLVYSHPQNKDNIPIMRARALNELMIEYPSRSDSIYNTAVDERIKRELVPNFRAWYTNQPMEDQYSDVEDILETMIDKADAGGEADAGDAISQTSKHSTDSLKQMARDLQIGRLYCEKRTQIDREFKGKKQQIPPSRITILTLNNRQYYVNQRTMDIVNNAGNSIGYIESDNSTGKLTPILFSNRN